MPGFLSYLDVESPGSYDTKRTREEKREEQRAGKRKFVLSRENSFLKESGPSSKEGYCSSAAVAAAS